MKVKMTNKLNLPEPLVRAVEFNDYDRVGDISVTEFIDSPRIKQLKRNIEVEEDVIDRVWALFGSAVHAILERTKNNVHGIGAMHKLETFQHLYKKIEYGNFSQEERKTLNKFLDYEKKELEEEFNKNKHELERYNIEHRMVHDVKGWKLSGKYDIYDRNKKHLEDYKVTSVWPIIFNDTWKWEAQENMYAWMMQNFENLEVNSSNIIAILRDWSESKSKREEDYPDSQISVVPIPLLPKEKMDVYVEKKMDQHQRAAKNYENGELDKLPECRPRDRWYKPGKIAVMKNGRKSAVKLYNEDEADQAQKHSESINGGYLDFRKGQNIRCERFCPVVSICSQAKKLGVEAAQDNNDYKSVK